MMKDEQQKYWSQNSNHDPIHCGKNLNNNKN